MPALDAPASGVPASGVQVTEDPMPGVQLVAVRPAWVAGAGRRRHGDLRGDHEQGAMSSTWPQTEDPATLRIGESGSVYFRGRRACITAPVGPARRGQFERSRWIPTGLVGTYAAADLSADGDLAELGPGGRTGARRLGGCGPCRIDRGWPGGRIAPR